MDELLRQAETLMLQYGYGILLLGLLLENVVLLGVVVPGFTILLLGGYYAGLGEFEVTKVYFVSLIGTMMGDNISYMLGRFVGEPVRKFSFFTKVKDESSITRRLVLFTHFSAYSRITVPIAAGLIKLRYINWLLWDMIGAVLWNLLYIILGYLAGYYSASYDWLRLQLKPIEWGAAILFIILVAQLIIKYSKS
ncbi:VTT domain-containing protein [candidate division WWE3 bacterium]|uniref:VTT domain-containing protein n=1 Tax=candidate division WWE3 bacterium TaxID=2053526 RepID=A0A955RWS2_UNCKA|nr:VTT domain-containing protein [candidate division WWE3 bacterium]